MDKSTRESLLKRMDAASCTALGGIFLNMSDKNAGFLLCKEMFLEFGTTYYQ